VTSKSKSDVPVPTGRETTRSSTGPRTREGKLRASRNSRTHGLFASELYFSAEEEEEFDRLKSKLRKDLAPEGGVLETVFDDLVSLAWRLKLTIRCEQAEVEKVLDPNQPNNSKANPRLQATPPTRFERQSDIRLLDQLREAVERGHQLPGDLEGVITERFGHKVWEVLTQWKSQDVFLMHMLVAAKNKAEFFDTKPPVEPPTPKEEDLYNQIGSLLKHEMALKVIDLLKHYLADQQRSNQTGQDPAAATSRLELFIRYQTAARREWYRVLREYMGLKVELGKGRRHN
jgi:hypothetical protein